MGANRIKRFKYKYLKPTNQQLNAEKYSRKFTSKYIKYVDVDLPHMAPDGLYLHRKSKYNHVVYFNIGGVCTEHNVNHFNEDNFRPQPVRIFMIDADTRAALIKSYHYLTSDMQYEVRCYEKHVSIRKENLRYFRSLKFDKVKYSNIPAEVSYDIK